MRKLTVILGKLVRGASRLRGGGSALPGLVVEKFDKNFLRDTLSKLPRGVVVVSGTNGKTTTTKMVSELLEGEGLKVFTNSTGSNFSRGVISAILSEIKWFKFDFDIAVLELDEAHAVQFAKQIKPSFTLLLNVLPDQVDRFGGVENTAKLLTEVAKNTAGTVILNREDHLIATIACSLPKSKTVKYFGYDEKLGKYFSLNGAQKLKTKTRNPNDVELLSFEGSQATYYIDKSPHEVSLRLTGVHNLLNAAGALATVKAVLPESDAGSLLKTLSKVGAAFGRGEVLEIGNHEVEMLLVKNPSGFRLSLLSQYDKTADVMIAINNNIGDGVDISWLKDVDFSKVHKVKVVSGMCTSDVLQRLEEDGVKSDLTEPDLKKALDILLQGSNKKQIFCNYTAMLQIRKLLGKIGKIEKAL